MQPKWIVKYCANKYNYCLYCKKEVSLYDWLFGEGYRTKSKKLFHPKHFERTPKYTYFCSMACLDQLITEVKEKAKKNQTKGNNDNEKI